MAEKHASSESTWMSITAAADAAGVSRRSAFRWVERGHVPCRVAGTRRVVAVEALRGFAASHHPGNRATQPDLAPNPATSGETGDAPPPPADGEIGEALETLSVQCTGNSEQIAALWTRLENLERHLGLTR